MGWETKKDMNPTVEVGMDPTEIWNNERFWIKVDIFSGFLIKKCNTAMNNWSEERRKNLGERCRNSYRLKRTNRQDDCLSRSTVGTT